MILSEQARRWAEIRFYYFCLDLYHIRHNMIDVILIIEVVCQIAELDFKTLKTLAGKIIGDPVYLPHRDEVVSLAYAMGIKKSNIHNFFEISKNTINTILNSKRNQIHTPYPQFTLQEDELMYRFCEVFQKVKEAGI